MSKDKIKREEIIFTKEEAYNLAIDDGIDGYTYIDELEEDGGHRWYNDVQLIIQRDSDGKYFGAWYQRGKTEMQYEKPFEYSEPIFYEVEKLTRVEEYWGWEK